jgi:replicative DNA helicase
MANSLSRKQVPSNPDAERQVLGAVLTDSKAIDTVATILQPEDFYIPKNQKIYEAALALYVGKEAIDSLTVISRIPEQKAAVLELIDGVRSAVNLESYSRLVKQAAEKRSILDVATQLADMAYDKELEEVKTFAKSVVTKVLTNDDERKSLLSPADQVQVLRDLIKSKREGGPVGTSTGFSRLDGLTGGLIPGSLVVVGARTSVGKSSFAENIAENVAKQGKATLYVSIEMDPEQMMYRFGKRWGLSESIIEYGTNDKDSNRALEALIEKKLALPLHIWNAPSASTVGIRAHLNQLQADVGDVGLVVVDYLQLMTDTFGGKIPEHLRLGMITKTLKHMAREYKLPVVLITQLNRNSDQRGVLPEPRLSDIRESGRIEEDADLILLLWREKEPDHMGNDTHMKIAKNRQGPLGTVPIIFNKPVFTFVEPTNAQLAARPVKDDDEDDDEYETAGLGGGIKEPYASSPEAPETGEEAPYYPPEDGY